MSAITDRDRWNVSTDSYHYRLYKWWQRMGGQGPAAAEPPRPIDLCHYMRVVLIWVWLRWFFTSKFKPWLVTSVVLFIGINAWGYSKWPDVMKDIFTVYLGVLFVVGLVVGIAYVAFLMGKGERWEAAGAKIETFVLRVGREVAKSGPFFTFIGRRILEPAATWFFLRTIYWRIYPWMIAAVIAFAAAAIIAPKDNVITVLIALGIFVGVVVAIVIIIFTLFWIGEKINDKAKARRAERVAALRVVPHEGDGIPVPRVSQTREFLRLIWQYIVSRKHRICPFIVPTEGPTAKKEGR